MKWVILLLVLSGCQSSFEKALDRSSSCAIDCDYQGASFYAVDITPKPQCICIFKLRGRR
jgi:hypothetical protein